MAKFLQIALNIPLNQTFTYLNINDDGSSRIGCRADINFGNRKTTGYIVGESDSLSEDCPVEEEKIRPVKKILDSTPLLNSDLIELSRWVSSYYLCSWGEALGAMLPNAKRETDSLGFSFVDELPQKKAKTLSEEQLRAIDSILDPSSQTNLHYLYGPTGTGKTEVFLQCASRILEQGKGVIYLVPEIGLTRQVIEAVVERFGPTAAVLHSGLTPSQKLSEYRRIINKEARVVIGARSAVFAPVPDLGMIIIDEEHDASYKSGSTPRYNARQVAIYRASKNRIPVVMGSATPSAESWYLFSTGKIQKHTLTKRLAGGAMPQIKCITLQNEASDTGCISKELESEVTQTLEEKRQVILFLNRRGFSHFYKCRSCGFELKCKNCSVALTYHLKENRLKCHYCGWSTLPPQQCPKCGSLDAGYSGFGTEFIENEVKAKFPNARICRLDTDSLTRKGELQEKLDAFKKNEYDIMLGTQMIAKGLNFPNLKLVGVILADTALHLPDFRASERTFSLLTQVAGRAGRFFPDGKVLIQTYSPESEPIYLSVTNQVQKFYDMELENRKMLNFPPFSRLVRIVFRSPTARQAESAAQGAVTIIKNKLNSILSQCKNSNTEKAVKTTEILGPSECPIVKIAQNYRYQIILKGRDVKILQNVTGDLLFNYTRPTDVYIESDVDPVSLL